MTGNTYFIFSAIRNCAECNAECSRHFRAVIADGEFRSELEDPESRERFHYLVSDTSTHPLHSLRYVRAAGARARDALWTHSRAHLARIFDVARGKRIGA